MPVRLVLRLLPLAVLAAEVAVAAGLAATGMRLWVSSTQTLWVALPLVLGLADLVLIPSVGSTVRPVPVAASEADARRISLAALRTVLWLRLALATAPALFGLLAALLAHSLLPLAIGIFFAAPLTLGYAYPSTRTVDEVRQRLEANGRASNLRRALSGPS